MQSNSSFKWPQAWKVKVEMEVSFTWTGKNTGTTTHMWLDKLPTAVHFKSGSVQANKNLVMVWDTLHSCLHIKQRNALAIAQTSLT